MNKNALAEFGARRKEKMTLWLSQHMEFLASNAYVWGFVLILFFMAVESSFIPFPSEVVMIPAGFLAYRGELTFGCFWPDAIAAVVLGTVGSLLGSWLNYYLSLWLGRPFLHRYGKYFFLSGPSLDRAEEVFREYGDITTFVCRLVPVIRQLISIPAGLARMNIRRFTFFTGLGAMIWVVILVAIGAYLGSLSAALSYEELVKKGMSILSENYIEIAIGLVVIVGIYLYIHRKVMHRKSLVVKA